MFFIKVAFAVAFAAIAVAAAGADRFQVIRPSDEAHRLLPKTCEVCHKEGNLKFFLVTSTDAAGLEDALRLLSSGARNIAISGASSPGGKAEANPHVMSTCLFCHTTTPAQGATSDQLEFRTVSGTVTGTENQAQLCGLCHQNLGEASHPKLYTSASKAASDMETAGLKLSDGKIVCTTCHDMHDPKAVLLSLKPKVRDFFRLSVNAYPHGRKFACLACHPTEQQPGTTPRFIDADPVKMCVRCHADEHSQHVYGVAGSEKSYPMDFLAFPLDKERKLACTTCHDEPCIKARDSKNPKMLRGGPYYRTIEFCDKCHPKGGDMAVNPHNQIGPDGKTISSVCGFCHKADPWGGEYGPGNMAYKETSSELCLNCHKFKPHPDRDHLVEIGDKRLDALKDYEARHKVKLPLGGKNVINCYTCHNPHGKGVLSGTEALGAGEVKYLRIPSFAEICTPCHRRYD